MDEYVRLVTGPLAEIGAQHLTEGVRGAALKDLKEEA